MSGPWEQFGGGQQQAAPAGEGPWALFGGSATAAPIMDFNRPITEVRGDIAKLPEAQRGPALKAWAKAYVTNERATRGPAGAAEDLVNTVADGVPVVNALAKKGAAGINAGIHALSGGNYGAPYDETRAYQDESQKQSDDAARVLGHIPKMVPFVGGAPVTSNTALKLAGGAIAAPVMPFPSATGGTLRSAMAKGSAAAAAYGTADAAAREDSLADAQTAAGRALGPSAFFGAIIPPAARGVGNAVGKTKAALAPLPAELKPYSRPAVDLVSTMAGHDNLATTGHGTSQLLGRQGMLADYGDNLRVTLEALASKTGDHMTGATNRLTRRAEGAPDRLNQGLNRTLGPPVNVPQSVKLMEEAASKAAAPHYDAFYNAPLKPTQELISIIQAMPEAAYTSASKLMKAERIDPSKTTSTGQMLDLMKRGLDDAIGSAKRAGEDNQVRVYSKLKNQLMAETDRILSPSDSSLSPWAQGRAIYAKDAGAVDALQAGRDAIKNKLHPDQMEADIAQLGSKHERELYQLGARDQFRTIGGEAATQWGPNGDAKMRAALQSEFSKQRVGMISDATGANGAPAPGQVQNIARSPSQVATGPNWHNGVTVPVAKAAPRAQALEDLVAAETVMAKTNNNVLSNSATARRTEAQKLFPDSSKAAPVPLSVQQLISGPLGKIAERLFSEPLNEKSIKLATDSARMLVAQGAEREAIIKGLLAYGQQAAKTPQQRVAITRVANQVLHSTRISISNGRTDNAR